MPRAPKPKPEAAAVPTVIVQTTVAPPEVVAPATEQSAPDVPGIPGIDVEGPESVIVVQGPEKGRRRAGYAFGPERVIIRLADLTDEQLCAIQDDPDLMVAVHFNPETV